MWKTKEEPSWELKMFVFLIFADYEGVHTSFRRWCRRIKWLPRSFVSFSSATQLMQDKRYGRMNQYYVSRLSLPVNWINWKQRKHSREIHISSHSPESVNSQLKNKGQFWSPLVFYSLLLPHYKIFILRS